MILAIDMGNTNIVIGGIDENKTSFVERITTNPSKTDIEYAVNIKDILEIYQIPLGEIEGAVLSSVVPPLNGTLLRAVEKIIKKKPLLVGSGMKTGLNILMDNCGRCGSYPGTSPAHYYYRYGNGNHDVRGGCCRELHRRRYPARS